MAVPLSQMATVTKYVLTQKLSGVKRYPLVLMLEPGTGEALEIPASFATFHERELIAEPDAVAAFSFFKEWLSVGGAA